MYKAVDIHSKKEIILLDPVWTRENIEVLRERDRLGALCCPGCKEPVRVRAGEKRRWHFAHKDLSDCSLRNESPEILEARGQLYTWLQSKFADRVTVEKTISGIPILLDCFVDTKEGGKIGYWILEKGIRSRDSIIGALALSDIQIVPIFLYKILSRDREDSNAVHLTPTERDFHFTSEYNRLYSQDDTGIVYLDETKGKIVTMRGLHCVHEPQKYEFNIMLTDDLSQMLVRKGTGELIHPGEYEKFCEWEKQKKEEKRLREIAEKKEFERRRLLKEKQQIFLEELERKAAEQMIQNQAVIGGRQPRLPNTSTIYKKKERKPSREDIFIMDQEPYPCEICGKTTAAWLSLDTKSNTCICSSECSRIKRNMKQR